MEGKALGPVSEEKLTEFSDWLQMSNPEDTLDGDTNNQDRMEEVEEACGEEDGLYCRHTASEAPSLVKTLGEVGNVGLGLQGKRD